MTRVQAGGPRKRDRVKVWFSEKGIYAWTVASGLVGLAGLWVDELGLFWKVCFCIVVAIMAAVSFRGFILRSKRQITETTRADKAEAEVTRLRGKLEESAPDRILESVGMALFVRPGAWRLTMFIVEQSVDKNWCLRPVITRSSSEVFESSPHGRISLMAGPLREILDVDVSDPLRPFTNESANLPDRKLDPDIWHELSARILQRYPDSLSMATRKFAWTAVKEPTSRRTYVLLSESVLPDGIRGDIVRSELLSTTIVLVSRMIESVTRSGVADETGSIESDPVPRYETLPNR